MPCYVNIVCLPALLPCALICTAALSLVSHFYGKGKKLHLPTCWLKNFGQAYIDVFFATCTAHMHCLSWGHSHCHLYSTYWVDDRLLCVHSSFIGFGFMTVSYIFVSPLKVPVHRRLLTITESSVVKTRMKCVMYKVRTAVCACVSFHQNIKCE